QVVPSTGGGPPGPGTGRNPRCARWSRGRERAGKLPAALGAAAGTAVRRGGLPPPGARRGAAAVNSCAIRGGDRLGLDPGTGLPFWGPLDRWSGFPVFPGGVIGSTGSFGD